MTQTFTIADVFPVNPENIFTAWLDSNEHSAFTESMVDIDPVEGGKFSAWDGYITGTTLEIVPYSKIVQSWRTADFPENAPDSIVELVFEPKGTGTQITLRHSRIPEGQADDYMKGWKEYYFAPMKVYFAEFDK